MSHFSSDSLEGAHDPTSPFPNRMHHHETPSLGSATEVGATAVQHAGEGPLTLGVNVLGILAGETAVAGEHIPQALGRYAMQNIAPIPSPVTVAPARPRDALDSTVSVPLIADSPIWQALNATRETAEPQQQHQHLAAPDPDRAGHQQPRETGGGWHAHRDGTSPQLRIVMQPAHQHQPQLESPAREPQPSYWTKTPTLTELANASIPLNWGAAPEHQPHIPHVENLLAVPAPETRAEITVTDLPAIVATEARPADFGYYNTPGELQQFLTDVHAEPRLKKAERFGDATGTLEQKLHAAVTANIRIDGTFASKEKLLDTIVEQVLSLPPEYAATVAELQELATPRLKRPKFIAKRLTLANMRGVVEDSLSHFQANGDPVASRALISEKWLDEEGKKVAYQLLPARTEGITRVTASSFAPLEHRQRAALDSNQLAQARREELQSIAPQQEEARRDASTRGRLRSMVTRNLSGLTGATPQELTKQIVTKLEEQRSKSKEFDEVAFVLDRLKEATKPKLNLRVRSGLSARHQKQLEAKIGSLLDQKPQDPRYPSLFVRGPAGYSIRAQPMNAPIQHTAPTYATASHNPAAAGGRPLDTSQSVAYSSSAGTWGQGIGQQQGPQPFPHVEAQPVKRASTRRTSEGGRHRAGQPPKLRNTGQTRGGRPQA